MRDISWKDVTEKFRKDAANWATIREEIIDAFTKEHELTATEIRSRQAEVERKLYKSENSPLLSTNLAGMERFYKCHKTQYLEKLTELIKALPAHEWRIAVPFKAPEVVDPVDYPVSNAIAKIHRSKNLLFIQEV